MLDYFLTGEAWIAIGLLLIVGEMVLPAGYVLLAFGVGSLVNGVLLYAGLAPTVFTRSVLANSAFVAALSFAVIFALRKFFAKTDEPDINKY